MIGAGNAADMIRRFREGAPMARQERDAAKAAGAVPDALWYSVGSKAGGHKDLPIHGDETRTHVAADHRDPLEYSDGSEPRIGITLQRPQQATRSISPTSRIAKYESKCVETVNVMIVMVFLAGIV